MKSVLFASCNYPMIVLHQQYSLLKNNFYKFFTIFELFNNKLSKLINMFISFNGNFMYSFFLQ